MRAIEGRAWLRRRLLGLNLVSLWAVRRLSKYMGKHLPGDSPALQQLPAFVLKVADAHELRLRRMGLVDRPLAGLSLLRRAALIVEAYGGKALGAFIDVLTLPLRLLPGVGRKKRLTETYLLDPALHRPELTATEPRPGE